MRSVMRGLQLGLVIAWGAVSADVVVEDFADWKGMSKLGGLWLAESDGLLGGTSVITETQGGKDIAKEPANIPMAYIKDKSAILTDVKVSADVGPAQKWAYAGWSMDYRPIDTTGTGKLPSQLLPWERKNEVNLATCDSMEFKIAFTPGRQIWVELYSASIAQKMQDIPQYGWRLTNATDAVTTRTFPLRGLGNKPLAKYISATPPPPLSQVMTTMNSIRFLYEGQEGTVGKDPAPYDALTHRLSIASIRLIGPNCKLENIAGIAHPGSKMSRRGLPMSFLGSRLVFGDAARWNRLDVKVRDLRGQIVARGTVNRANPALELPALARGVYTVSAGDGRLQGSLTFSRVE